MSNDNTIQFECRCGEKLTVDKVQTFSNTACVIVVDPCQCCLQKQAEESFDYGLNGGEFDDCL